MHWDKLARVGLTAALLVAAHGIAGAQAIDPCKSYSEFVAVGPSPLQGPCYFACPAGDSDTFLDSGTLPGPGAGDGWYIRIRVREADGTPVPNVPATDIWIVDCDPVDDLVLCAGAASSNADSLTNAQGYTTMSVTTLAAGGCAEGLAVVVDGTALLDSVTNCANVICHDIDVRSADINGDLCVDLADLSIFAQSFPPQFYDPCCDFECNGVVNLADLGRIARHFGPPGHECSSPGCP